MSSTFLTFSFFGWALGAVLGGIYDTLNLQVSDFNVISQFDIFREFEVDLPGIAPLKFPFPNGEFFGAIGSVLVWDSAIWTGWASYLRIFFLMALSFGMIVPMLMSFFSARLTR